MHGLSYSPIVYQVTYVAYIIIILTLFISIYVFGSPLLQKIDRFVYWTNHPYPIIMSVKTKLTILSFMSGLLIANRYTRMRCIHYAAMLLVVILNVLLGEKFSGIYSSIVLYLMPIAVTNSNHFYDKLVSLKNISITIVIMLMLSSLIFYQYSKIYGGAGAVLEIVGSRVFGLQGHVWWGVDDNVNRTKGNYNINYDILFGKSKLDENAGMYSLMYAVSPRVIVDNYIEKNARFTMANPAIGLYALGPYGLIVYQIVTGALFGYFCFYFTRQIIKKHFIRSVVVCFMYLAAFEALIMGNWYIIVSFYFIKYIVILILLEITESFNYVYRKKKLTVAR